MWFKNLQLYRLASPFPLALAQLEEQLGRVVFTRCGSQDKQSRGWVPPRGKLEKADKDAASAALPLVHSVGGQWLIAMATEHRLLPSSVVNQVAADRADELEAQQGFRPGRKQLRELKERVTEELLPRAFTRRSTTWLWLDPVNGWLAVDAASRGKADDALELLAKSLDDFPVKPIKTERSPTSAMADWLAAGEAPAGFTVDRDCELKAVSDEKSTVRYVRHALDTDEVQAQVRTHLEAGKLPTRLALTWGDRLSFVLTEKLEIKRLAHLDTKEEEANEANGANGDELFDAEFALMSGELQRFLPDLLEALGGEIRDGEGAPVEATAGATAAVKPASPAPAPATTADDDPPF